MFCIGVVFAEYLFLSSGAQNVNEFFHRKQKKLQKSDKTENTIKTLKCYFYFFFDTSFFDDAG